MQINNNELIKEFGALINTAKMTVLEHNKYNDLLETVKQLAEHKNCADAQYYLARHFLLINDINNYKFWLMRAARNIQPHPLANIQSVKFCLKKYYALSVAQPSLAATYLTMAQNRLRFILSFTMPAVHQRVDWIYVKEQAEIIWQKEFARPSEPVDVWLVPDSSKLTPVDHDNYWGLAQQAAKISVRIKNLLYKWQVKSNANI